MKFLTNHWFHLALAWVLFMGVVGPLLISAKSDTGVGLGISLGLALVVITTREIAGINFTKENKS